MSDNLILFLGIEDLAYHTVKGLIFVAVTSILLFFLLKNYFSQLNDKIREVTEKQNIEKKLRQEISQKVDSITALINNSGDIIWSVDKHLNLVIANQAFHNRIKSRYNVNIPLGDYVLEDSLPEKFKTTWLAHYSRALAGESFSIEAEVKNPTNGKNEYIEIRISPIFSQNEEIIGVCCVGRNFTQRKQHELLIEEKNKRLMDIAWSQSHEFRTPLSRIMGLIYLIDEEYEIAEEHRQILKYIKDSCEELDQMIHKIAKLTENIEDLKS